MRFRKYARWFLVGIILVILPLSFLACAAPAAEVEETAVGEIIVTPWSGKVGTVISVAGAGFVPGEEVLLVMEVGGVTNVLGQRAPHWGPVIASDDGGFSASTKIPRVPLEPGVYTLEARGSEGTIAFHPIEVTE